MGRLRTLMTIALLLAATSAYAQVPRSVCDPKMFKDYISDNSHLSLTLATLRLIDKDNFASFRTNFGSSIKIPIQGETVSFGENYASFNRERNHVFSEYRYHSTENESRSYLRFTFSGLSYKAYRDCLDHKVLAAHGVHIFIRHPTQTSFAAVILWRPPPGPATARRFKVSVRTGSAAPKFRYILVQPNGEKPIIVSRDPKHNIRVDVSDKSGAYYDDLLVAATPKIHHLPPARSCFWRHTLQFMNSINDPRLQAMFPQVYSKHQDGEGRVEALARHGYYYAAQGGGGRDWTFDVKAWGVPSSGELNSDIAIKSLNPANFGQFSFHAWRADAHHLTLRAYSSKGGAVTQVSVEFTFQQHGRCPAVPR